MHGPSNETSVFDIWWPQGFKVINFIIALLL